MIKFIKMLLFYPHPQQEKQAALLREMESLREEMRRINNSKECAAALLRESISYSPSEVQRRLALTQPTDHGFYAVRSIIRHEKAMAAGELRNQQAAGTASAAFAQGRYDALCAVEERIATSWAKSQDEKLSDPDEENSVGQQRSAPPKSST